MLYAQLQEFIIDLFNLSEGVIQEMETSHDEIDFTGHMALYVVHHFYYARMSAFKKYVDLHYAKIQAIHFLCMFLKLVKNRKMQKPVMIEKSSPSGSIFFP